MDDQKEQRKNRHVVLFPSPLQGHITPMLQLANILHTRGISITIIHTHFNSPDTTKYPHFTFHLIPDGLSESETSTKDVIALISKLNSNLLEPLHDCLAKLLSDGKEETIACLITDASWHFSQTVADELKLPRIVLRTSGLSSFTVYAALPLLFEKGYLPKQESRLDDLVQELPPLRVKDLPSINTHNADGFYKFIEHMVSKTKAASGIIWNSFENLESSALVSIHREFPVPNFLIGPFHKYFTASKSSLLTQDRSSISWLDKQKPKSVLYVSFGSIARVDKTKFLEMAWGLVHSEQPFLWVIRPDLVHDSEWLEILPIDFMDTFGKRGHIVKWAPQEEVLAHPSVGGFWTHNGWNSTLESICEGVPMICSPILSDQFVNARYVTDVWRIGLRIETNVLERGVVEKAIRRLMVEREGEELRDRIQVLQDKVNNSLMEGGSSYRNLDTLVKNISSF